MDIMLPLALQVVTPLFVWSGLAAMSVPVLIHLLNRRRFRRVRWAAMEFVLQAYRRNRRRIELQNLLLLALRCAAVGLAGVLVARPLLSATGLLSLVAPAPHTQHILVLDDSFSMGYLHGARTVFERAREQMLNMVEELAARAPGDTATVLVTSQPESPLLSRGYLDAEQVRSLRGLAAGLTPAPVPARWDRALKRVIDMLESSRDAQRVELYLISDFQQADWSGTEPGADPAGLGVLRDWHGRRGALGVHLIDVGVADAANLAVRDLVPLQRQYVAGLGGRFEVEVVNHSRRPVRDRLLRVYVQEAEQRAVTLPEIAPGQSVRVPLELALPYAGAGAVRVELEADGLSVDNARLCAVDVRDSVRVVVVNGHPSNDPRLDGARLLAAALQPPGRIRSGNDVRVIGESELDEAALTDADLVVLSDVRRVSPSVAGALERFVRQGGGLVMFLGSRTRPQACNRLLYAGGRGVLPARIGELIDARADGRGATLLVETPPPRWLEVYAGTDEPYTRDLHFERFWELEVPEGAESGEAADEAGGDEEQAGADSGEAGEARGRARVVAWFAGQGRHPAIVEKRFGQGRVVVVATTASMEFNDWAMSPAYVVTMLEMVQHVARADIAPPRVLVGSPIRLIIDPGEWSPRARLRRPDYPASPEQPLLAQPADGSGRLVFETAPAEQPGLYVLVTTDRGGREREVWAAVNVDTRESDLARADLEEISRALAPVPVTLSGPKGAPQSPVLAGEQELWPVVVLSLVALLMMEQVLAWWFGTREGA